jgi:hypothetical protein
LLDTPALQRVFHRSPAVTGVPGGQKLIMVENGSIFDMRHRVQDKPIGTTVEHLRVGGVETLMIPLPPPDEQRRIVTKVNELMAVCDDLERSLAAVDVGRTRALEAVLHEVLEEVGDNVPALVEVAG